MITSAVPLLFRQKADTRRRCNGRKPGAFYLPGRAFFALLEGISTRRSLLPCTDPAALWREVTEARVLVIALGVSIRIYFWVGS